jgi:hypothetical protein
LSCRSQEESDDEEEEAKPVAKKTKTEVTPAAAPAGEDEEDDGNVGIFIKNLPWKVTEDDVAKFFADAGEVVNVRLGDPIRPPTPCVVMSLARVAADDFSRLKEHEANLPHLCHIALFLWDNCHRPGEACHAPSWQHSILKSMWIMHRSARNVPC